VTDTYSPFQQTEPIAITDLTSERPAPAPSQNFAQQVIGAAPDLSALMPSALTRPLGITHAAPAPRVVSSQPNYTTQLSNKYSDPEIANAYASLPEQFRNGLIRYDAQRVAGGSPPMTKDETLRAIQTLRDNKPATPAPERSLLDVPGNILHDLGDVIRAIPRIPGAIVGEVGQLGQMAHTGRGGLADLAASPGIRMIPGAYTVGNLASGGSGVRELATHPLMTFLDLLPGASKLAEGTGVVRAAQEAADLAGGGKVRPLGVLATRTLDDAGQVIPNALGETLNNFRGETRLGQAIDAGFGRRSRGLARMWETINQRVNAQAAGLVDGGTVGRLTEAASNLNRTFTEQYGWDAAKFRELHDIAVTGDPAVLRSLPAPELSYINTARDLATAYGNVALHDGEGLARIVDPRSGVAEFYPSDKAMQINRARALSDHASRMMELRRQYLSEHADLTSPLDASAINKMTEDALSIERSGGSKQWVAREMRAIMQVVDAHGYDVAAIDKVRSAASHGKGSWADFADTIDSEIARQDALNAASGITRTRMPITDIITELRRHKTDPQAQMLATGLARRDTKLVTYALKNLEQRTNWRLPILDNPDFAATVRSLRRRYAFENDIGRYFTPTTAAKRAARAEKMLSQTPPARFGPRIARDATNATVNEAIPVAEYAIGRSLSADEAGRVATAVQMAHWNAVEDLGIPAEHLKALHSDLQAEIAGTWRDLVEQGVDPVFVHNVSLGRARGMANPSVGPVPQSLSQVKDRALDFTPSVQDLGVALTHQGLEMLTRRGSEEFIDFIADRYGVTQQALQDIHAGRAAELARVDTTFDPRGHLQRLIDRGWVKFNPEEVGYSWGGSRLNKYQQDVVFIPKAIAKNLKQMHDPASPLIAAMSPITRTFRLSVVGLSPRTQLYNILGGATMLLGETGPSAFKYARQAREWVRNPGSITDEVLRATIGSEKRALLDDAALAAPRANLLAGRTLGRIWQQIQEARPGGKVRDAFGKVIDKSLDLNAFFDDTYRVMGYLYGRDKALTRGLTPEMAERAGMELTRKVMMDWTGMTPFERGVLKQIFPFYGFMNHAMRYVMRYPVDHPMRAEIVASFGRAEADDSKILPASFLSALFFGDMDASGNRNALNTAPINPFGDVANMFTIAGFLGATNPLINTALEQAGLVRGQAELYPTLRYDPETGRLSASHGNPLMMLLENTIPQTAVLTSLLGLNGEFRDRMQRDPASASRFLASSMGLPILWRSWSIPAEAAKAEVARGKAEDKVRTEALRTGDWTEALRYPGLRDNYQQLLAATPQELAQYQPQGADIYEAMIEQALGQQQVQANINAQQRQQATLGAISPFLQSSSPAG